MTSKSENKAIGMNGRKSINDRRNGAAASSGRNITRIKTGIATTSATESASGIAPATDIGPERTIRRPAKKRRIAKARGINAGATAIAEAQGTEQAIAAASQIGRATPSRRRR